MHRRIATALVILMLLAAPGAGASQAPVDPAVDTRLVVIKVDGLPQSLVDAYVARPDPRTGRSVLPWIQHLFYDSGVRTANYYSRGLSLSEPSWAVIDTGQHSIIKGNFEIDRNTGDAADHLSFVGFYVDSVKGQRVYPPGVEALDACRTPLLSDAWHVEDRETGIQLLRRGTRWFELLKVGVDPARRGTIVERVGDLVIGVNEVDVWAKVSEERFLEAARDPRIRYADFYWPYIDEAIHDDNSAASLTAALSNFDRMLGRAQQAIAESGAANRTVLAVVSDHGATFDGEGHYSQGINLIGYLERPEFGAHHTMSRGGPLANYELKGSAFNPFSSSPAVSSTKNSAYLADRPDQITCALDYDGNERAQLHFRDPDLTRLQMLWRALRGGRLDAKRASIAARGALAILERRRSAWTSEARELTEEVGALDRRVAFLKREQLRLDRSIAQNEKDRSDKTRASLPHLAPFAGESALNYRDPYQDLVGRRGELGAELFRVETLRFEYGAFRDRLSARLHIATPAEFESASETSLFGFRDFGRHLDVADLMSYPARLRDVIAGASGELDEWASFDTVDYLSAFGSIRIRNSATAGRGTSPVSWAVAELDAVSATTALECMGAVVRLSSRAFLVQADSQRQLLMLQRSEVDGTVAISLIPIAGFSVDPATRAYAFELAAWRAGLPFGLFEDVRLKTSGADRATWLAAEHSVNEWRDATHETFEGLAVAGLAEVYSTSYRKTFDDLLSRTADADARFLLRFERRRRDAVASDLFLHASPHWNFDLKDFNAGGNHGGFSRESMRGVFWMRGGVQTRLQSGPLVLDRPCDGLDVAPTLLEAGGRTTSGVLTEDLRRGGFRDFPGRLLREAFRP